MNERSAKAAGKSAGSDDMAATEITNETAIELAGRWLKELCGERRWNDNRESMIARGARKVPMSPRRARAIIQKEQHVRVSGDEILAIQRARTALGSLSTLARAADARANNEAGGQGQGALPQGDIPARQVRG